MDGWHDDKRDGKEDKKSTKIPFVKFFVKGMSGSSFSISQSCSDGDDTDQFAISFEESPTFISDEFVRLDQTKRRSDVSEQLKLSKPHQILSVWKKNSLYNKTESMRRASVNLSKLETNDCNDDLLASCSFGDEYHGGKAASVDKKTQLATSTQRNDLHSTRASDRDSIGSNESSHRCEKTSRFSAIFDKAKNRGRKLVSSHKNKNEAGESNSIEETCNIVAVGQDALYMDLECKEQSKNAAALSIPKDEAPNNQSSFYDCFDVNESNDAGSAHKFHPLIFHFMIDRFRHLPFLKYRVVFLIVLSSLTVVFPGFISGFLWGLYLSFVGFLYFFVSEPVKKDLYTPKDVVVDISKELEEQKASKNEIYRGWMNELRGRYDSSTYHVNNAQTVLVRLDGNLLRISRPERTVYKHAFHTDPTLTELEPTICSQSIYELTGAEVTLRPKRLARRRWWSRKYPIHIRLASKDSEISTSALQRSHSVHETIELARSASSDDEADDLANEQQLSGEKKKKSRSPKMVDALDEKSLDCNSQGSSDEESCHSCLKNGRANSASDLTSFSSEYPVECLRSTTNGCRGRSLYLFVRSAREKERWFHRLREACSQYNTKVHEVSKSNMKEFVPPLVERRLSLPPTPKASNSPKLNLEYFLYVSNHVQFEKCIGDVLKNSFKKHEKRTGNGVISMDLGRNKWIPGKPDTDSQLVMSANALAARIFYDFCRDSYWCKQVQDKIQSKLAAVHLPYFIETLELSKLDLGTTPPEIVAVYAPVLDDWGLWIDFELKYRGGIHLTLETKVNLMKLKEGIRKNAMYKEIGKVRNSVRVHRYSDSDLPESPESSPDEDFGSKAEKAPTARESTGKKLLSVVDKIASSNIFQGASELKPVKKMMEGISSTRLLLNVDVTCLEGTMTTNIPPPPSDRLWYAFRTPPKLSIRSVPQVGDRSVDMTTVSSWIENKLRLLLEKNLVCPNMDDLIVPVMSGNELLKGGYNC